MVTLVSCGAKDLTSSPVTDGGVACALEAVYASSKGTKGEVRDARTGSGRLRETAWLMSVMSNGYGRPPWRGASCVYEVVILAKRQDAMSYATC